MLLLLRAAALAALAIIAVPAPVAAVDSPATLTFGVQPARAGMGDNRPWFTYDVDPGAVLADQLLVVNSSSSPVSLDVYATDAFTGRDGAFDLLPRSAMPSDVGTWVRLSTGRVVVPARGKAVIPFTVTVPAGASPGDHAGGVVVSLASARTTPTGSRLDVEQRVGARVYARVRGPLRASVAVERLAASYEPSWNPFARGVADVSYVVRNTGNVRLAARDTLRLSGLLGTTVVARPAQLEELLVGDAVVVTAREEVWPGGRLTATAEAVPVPAVGELPLRPEGGSATTTFWAIPWAALGALVPALVLIALAVRLRRPTPATGRHRAGRPALAGTSSG